MESACEQGSGGITAKPRGLVVRCSPAAIAPQLHTQSDHVSGSARALRSASASPSPSASPVTPSFADCERSRLQWPKPRKSTTWLRKRLRPQVRAKLRILVMTALAVYAAAYMGVWDWLPLSRRGFVPKELDVVSEHPQPVQIANLAVLILCCILKKKPRTTVLHYRSTQGENILESY